VTDLHSLPSDLPIPMDDGAARHLVGLHLPPMRLPSTLGAPVKLDALSGISVIYAYPMTGRPDMALPENWDLIPGARGCTPQACSYRDHYSELQSLGAELYGLSTQSPDYQTEMAKRLHLPFAVLSDEALNLTASLALPTFEANGMRLLKRLTLVCQDTKIIHVNYPVFPPDQDIDRVIAFLKKLD
jgi:peroxiredoxin